MSFTKFRISNGPVLGPEVPCKAVPDWPDMHYHPSLAYLTLTEKKPPPRCHLSNGLIVPDSEADSNPLAAHLRELTHTLLYLLCNEKDYSNPLLRKHMAPTFSASQDNTDNSVNIDDHLATWARITKRIPNFHAEIIESVAKIHENGKKADVWTLQRLSGLPINDEAVKGGMYAGDGWICKEAVGAMRWEIRDGVWVCVRLKMLRGVSGLE